MRIADDIVAITTNAVLILSCLTEAKELNKRLESVEDEIRELEQKRDILLASKRALETEARLLYNSRKK